MKPFKEGELIVIEIVVVNGESKGLIGEVMESNEIAIALKHPRTKTRHWINMQSASVVSARTLMEDELKVFKRGLEEE